MPPSTQRKRDNEDELQATKHDKDLDGEGQSADGESEADEGKSGEEVAGSRTPYKANDDDEGTDELDDDEDQTPADGAASLPPAEATKRASPSKTYGKKSSSKRTATKEKIGSNKGKGKAKAKNAPEQGESDETDFHSAEEGEGGDVDEACAPRTSTRTKKPTAPRRKPSTSQKSKSAASSSARSSKKRPRSPEAAAQDDEDDSEAYSAEEEDEENEDEDSPPSSKRKKKKPAAPRSSQASSSRHKQKKRRTRKGKEKGTSGPGTRTGRVFSDVEEEEEDSDAESQGGLDEDDPPNIFLHLDRRGKNWVPDKIWLHEGHWRNGVREMWERRIPVRLSLIPPLFLQRLTSPENRIMAANSSPPLLPESSLCLPIRTRRGTRTNTASNTRSPRSRVRFRLLTFASPCQLTLPFIQPISSFMTTGWTPATIALRTTRTCTSAALLPTSPPVLLLLDPNAPPSVTALGPCPILAPHLELLKGTRPLDTGRKSRRFIDGIKWSMMTEKNGGRGGRSGTTWRRSMLRRMQRTITHMRDRVGCRRKRRGRRMGKRGYVFPLPPLPTYRLTALPALSLCFTDQTTSRSLNLPLSILSSSLSVSRFLFQFCCFLALGCRRRLGSKGLLSLPPPLSGKRLRRDDFKNDRFSCSTFERSREFDGPRPNPFVLMICMTGSSGNLRLPTSEMYRSSKAALRSVERAATAALAVCMRLGPERALMRGFSEKMSSPGAKERAATSPFPFPGMSTRRTGGLAGMVRAGGKGVNGSHEGKGEEDRVKEKRTDKVPSLHVLRKRETSLRGRCARYRRRDCRL
jgi:hypothetical protein